MIWWAMPTFVFALEGALQIEADDEHEARDMLTRLLMAAMADYGLEGGIDIYAEGELDEEISITGHTLAMTEH